MRGNPAKRHNVAVLISEGVSPFELGAASEVFGIDRSELGVPWYRFRVCAVEPGPVPTCTGFDVVAPYGLEALAWAHTIVVAPPGDGIEQPQVVLDAIARAHRRGTRMLSLCTGALVLAAAGVLDGRPATTHWRHSEELARRFPLVCVDPAVLYVDDGLILTSAGSAAAIDLCLHVVANDFGADVANSLARRMVVPPHRDGGQAQFIETPLGPIDPGDRFAGTIEWAQSHLHETITIETLADRAAMSPRSFARRFHEATGSTPYRWVLRQRVLLAQRLLETSDLGVELIAERCGLAPPALREQFQRTVGTSPSRYRSTFRRDIA